MISYWLVLVQFMSYIIGKVIKYVFDIYVYTTIYIIGIVVHIIELRHVRFSIFSY